MVTNQVLDSIHETHQMQCPEKGLHLTTALALSMELGDQFQVEAREKTRGFFTMVTNVYMPSRNVRFVVAVNTHYFSLHYSIF